MTSRCIGRTRMSVAAGAVLIAMGVLAAGCGAGGNQAPTTTTTTTPTTTTTTMLPGGAPPLPTEKDLSPTGGNLFTPPVKATPAPTVPPGQHPGLHGIP
jgi:ABC-type glycerol-3-phosphate transport system substrate-binding protein